jgi:anti-sigma factor RsiW
VSEVQSWGCRSALRAIHRGLDGDPLEPALERQVDEHLATCADCREAAAELRAIQEGLRRLPLERMPDAALEEVLAATVGSRRAGTLRRFGFDWRLAAAAIVTVGVIGSWYALFPPSGRPSDTELREAAVEARAVLALTAQALRKAERAATRDVLAGQLSPALRRVPIDWPAPDSGGEEGRQAR